MAYKKRGGGSKSDFKENVLKVLSSGVAEDGKTKSELRIISWIVDGKAHRPKIERRDFRIAKDGGWRADKCKGLTDSDFITLLDNKMEIGTLLQIPQGTILATEGSGKPEGEVPF